jgi:hypothetical protein
MTKDLAQLNARVHKPVHRTLRAVAGMTGMKMEDILTDALCLYFGIADEMLEERRKLSQSAVKRFGASKELQSVLAQPR